MHVDEADFANLVSSCVQAGERDVRLRIGLCMTVGRLSLLSFLSLSVFPTHFLIISTCQPSRNLFFTDYPLIDHLVEYLRTWKELKNNEQEMNRQDWMATERTWIGNEWEWIEIARGLKKLLGMRVPNFIHYLTTSFLGGSFALLDFGPETNSLFHVFFIRDS